MLKRVVCFVSLAVLATTSFAAEYLQYNSGWNGGGISGQSVSGYDTLSGASYSYGGSVYVGQIGVQYKNTATTNTYGSTFQTYCITPSVILGNGGNPWAINSPVLINGGNSLSIFDRIARLSSNASIAVGTDVYSAALNDQISGAFQLALWSIVNSTNTPAFASGHLTGTVLSWYNTFIGISNNTSQTGSFVAFYPNPLSGSQILITGTGNNGGGFSPVPEPFTMGLGLAAAGAFIRRRIKSKQTA